MVVPSAEHLSQVPDLVAVAGFVVDRMDDLAPHDLMPTLWQGSRKDRRGPQSERLGG